MKCRRTIACYYFQKWLNCLNYFIKFAIQLKRQGSKNINKIHLETPKRCRYTLTAQSWRVKQIGTGFYQHMAVACLDGEGSSPGRSPSPMFYWISLVTERNLYSCLYFIQNPALRQLLRLIASTDSQHSLGLFDTFQVSIAIFVANIDQVFTLSV